MEFREIPEIEHGGETMVTYAATLNYLTLTGLMYEYGRVQGAQMVYRSVRITIVRRSTGPGPLAHISQKLRTWERDRPRKPPESVISRLRVERTWETLCLRSHGLNCSCPCIPGFVRAYHIAGAYNLCSLRARPALTSAECQNDPSEACGNRNACRLF